jgi:hypothetical protein
VQLASSVNDSLVSLDFLHTAAGGLDTKLQHTLEQQVWRAQSCISGFAPAQRHILIAEFLCRTISATCKCQLNFNTGRAHAPVSIFMLQRALAHRQAEMLRGLSDLEAQERKVLAATSALHQVLPQRALM